LFLPTVFVCSNFNILSDLCVNYQNESLILFEACWQSGNCRHHCVKPTSS